MVIERSFEVETPGVCRDRRDRSRLAPSRKAAFVFALSYFLDDLAVEGARKTPIRNDHQFSTKDAPKDDGS